MGGSFGASIAKLLVTLAILAFTYFVIVKPILHSVNDSIDKATKQQNSQTVNSQNIQRSIQRDIRRTTRQTQRQVNHALNSAGIHKQFKLLHCVQRSAGNTTRMTACSRRFAP
jgi:uncharacterized membrane protein YhiD involved in acid resistance